VSSEPPGFIADIWIDSAWAEYDARMAMGDEVGAARLLIEMQPMLAMSSAYHRMAQRRQWWKRWLRR
jgi:predicted membrane channel-forming protein YqfA (hemolysin III family)